MAENKKEQEVKKETPPVSTSPESGTPKKKSNTIWYIIGGILLVLILIPVVGFFFLRGVFNRFVGNIEEAVEQYEQDWDQGEDQAIEIVEDEDGEETWGFRKSTEEGVDGELEKEDLVTDRFPEDIPISGGIVTSSSYDNWNIEVNLDIDSSVEEILEWYANALEEEGWEITSRSSQEAMDGWISGSLQFTKEDEDRQGRLNADTNPYQEVTSVRLRETL